MIIKNKKLIKVFYDGKCQLCDREINYYKKISPQGIFNWLDIATEPNHLSDFNITQIEALKKIHVIDENDQIKIGIDAFIEIWKRLKFWKFLALLISIPIIKSFADVIYDKFANYRFSKLEHCKILINK